MSLFTTQFAFNVTLPPFLSNPYEPPAFKSYSWVESHFRCQPLKVYPALVGFWLLKVNVVPYVFIWLDGAFVPPFAS